MYALSLLFDLSLIFLFPVMYYCKLIMNYGGNLVKKSYSTLYSSLLILLLSACSADTEVKTDDKVETDIARKVVTEEVERGVIPVADLEDRDYGGLTLKFAGPLLRDINPEESEIKEKWYERTKELEEKWNFVFESKTIPNDDFIGSYIRTTLAGDPVGDIVYLNIPQFYPKFPDNGIAYPISDLNVLDFDDPKWVQAARTASEYKGKTYSVKPGTIELTVAKNGIWWNKTQFNNLGLPNLYDLYENGEWTWEKMFEVAEQATKDLDNDGKTDVYGFSPGNLPYDLIYSNGAEAVNKTNEGIEVDFNDPKIVEALEYYQKAFEDHARVFLQPVEEGGGVDSLGDFRDGRLLMLPGDWWYSTSALNEGRMKDEYGFIPYPLGPSYDLAAPVSSVGGVSLEIMLGTVEKPKEKLEIWDEITNIGTAEDWERWTRSEYEKGAADAQSVEYALLLHDHVKVNVISGFTELNELVSKFFGEIRAGETTVVSGLEAIDPQIKAALATFKKDGADLGVTKEEIEQTKKELEDGTYYDEEEEVDKE